MSPESNMCHQSVGWLFLRAWLEGKPSRAAVVNHINKKYFSFSSQKTLQSYKEEPTILKPLHHHITFVFRQFHDFGPRASGSLHIIGFAENSKTSVALLAVKIFIRKKTRKTDGLNNKEWKKMQVTIRK